LHTEIQIMKVAVIGAGTMGNGIAHVFAQNGHEVNLIDIDSNRLDQAIATITKNLNRQLAKDRISEADRDATLSRISTQTSLSDHVGDRELIVEAATEHVELKKKIFAEMDAHSSADCILATNTSSISITDLASVTSNPSHVIGMHFMNPVPVMKLVEVIRGKQTSDEVTASIMNLSKAIGKIPVEVNDAPGFVANRILMPMINEAIYCIHEGVSGIEEVDTVMNLGMAHPMGPLHLADFVGLDVCLAILEVIQQGFNSNKYQPCPLLVDMVNNGELGVKSGMGFYQYEKGSKEKHVAPRFKK